MTQRAGSACQLLRAANGTISLRFGARIVPLHFGGRRYSARRIPADVKRPLLGADFMRQHNLSFDIRGQRLIEADPHLSVLCGITAAPVNEFALIHTSINQFRKVRAENAVLAPNDTVY